MVNIGKANMLLTVLNDEMIQNQIVRNGKFSLVAAYILFLLAIVIVSSKAKHGKVYYGNDVTYEGTHLVDKTGDLYK